MKYAWIILGVFAARFFTTAITFPPGDGDLGWQRWLGATIRATHTIPRRLGNETFTAPGAPWVPQEWAFSLAASLARHGPAWIAFSGFAAFCAIAALAIAGTHAERRGASPTAIAVCVTLGGLACFESFGVRVQVVAWPLIAIFVLLLDVDGPWAYAAIGVAALWSNVHASAMLAPVLAAAAAVGAWLDARAFAPEVRRLAIIALASAVAICCNPFGWDLPGYAIMLFTSPIKTMINEWKVTDLGQYAFVYGSLPLLLGALVFVPLDPRRRFRDVLLLAALAVLVLGAARNIAVFGIVASAIVAPAMTRGVRAFAASAEVPSERERRIAAVAMPLLGALVAVVVVIGLLRNPERADDTVAVGAIAHVATLPGERRLFCLDFAWCSLAVGAPHVRVFLDGRADPYPWPVWKEARKLAYLEPDWREPLDRYDVNTIVVTKDSPLDQALLLVRGWRAEWSDKRYRVWVRAPSARDVSRLERPGRRDLGRT
jgi:hypothetical protein